MAVSLFSTQPLSKCALALLASAVLFSGFCTPAAAARVRGSVVIDYRVGHAHHHRPYAYYPTYYPYPVYSAAVWGPWPYPYAGYGGSVVVEAPVVVARSEPVVVTPTPAAPTLPADPILYPRNGQSPLQTQADRQECLQWASAQPQANETTVFQRALSACLDGRGYTVR